jgi:hypothetical protein
MLPSAHLDTQATPRSRGSHLRPLNMTQVSFHCSNAKKVFVDRFRTVVGNLAEARDHATKVVRSLAKTWSPDDWRDWVLHVSDDLGDELFVVPFAFVLGKSHGMRNFSASVRQVRQRGDNNAQLL